MNQLKNLEAENASLTFQIDKSSTTIQQEQSLRIQTQERETALASYTGLQTKLAALKIELEQYGQCEGGEVERKKRAEYLTREAALRWTENVNIARDHFCRILPVKKADMDEHFGIGNNWDELENM
jgi:RNA polymerase-binding transcription factor DksA